MRSLNRKLETGCRLTLGWAVCVGVAAVRADVTPAARYAAAQVDPANYRHIHADLLYTHDGDDRRWGLEHDLARDNIEALFVDYGLATTLHPFQYLGNTYFNVVAELPGTTRPQDVYIVGAHYDSYSSAGPAPGADDNASGVAAVLEIARLVSRWPSQATIRLIAFDREEQGLIGSQAYAGQHSADNILGMLALDMIAFRQSAHREVIVFGRDASNDLKYAVAEALNEHGQLATYIGGERDRSDHAPFEWLGFQACQVREYNPGLLNPYYHDPLDSVDTHGYIDYEYATAITRGVMGWLVDAAGVQPDHPVGDLNCDYAVDSRDVNPFVLALVNPAGYLAAYPSCDRLLADGNQDGQVDLADVNPFLVHLLAPCQDPQVSARLTLSQPIPNVAYGAAAAIDGDTVLVGASLEDAPEWMSGSVYVFERADGGWTETGKLTPLDAAAGDFFGSSIALRGQLAAIGALGKDEAGEDSGAAYIFERLAGVWTQTAKLVPQDGEPFQYFGQAVAVSGDLVVVGAPGDSSAAAYAGAAYVFQRINDTWVQTAKLTAPDASDLDYLGAAVAVDGGLILAGARNDDQNGPESGSVYAFAPAADTWNLTAKLTPADAREYDLRLRSGPQRPDRRHRCPPARRGPHSSLRRRVRLRTDRRGLEPDGQTG